MKKTLSLIYKVAAIATTAYGLYLNFEHSGIKRMIVYFTILSNIAILVFFIFQFICEILKLEKTKTYYILKLLLLVNISITMFAFEFVVRPYINNQTGYSSMNLRDSIVHIVVPIITILDYFVFDKKGNFSFEYVPFTIISPILYLIFCFIYGNFGGSFTAFKQISKYPYIFMDFDLLGNFAYIGCILTLLVFMGIAWLIVFLDEHFYKSISKREP